MCLLKLEIWLWNRKLRNFISIGKKNACMHYMILFNMNNSCSHLLFLSWMLEEFCCHLTQNWNRKTVKRCHCSLFLLHYLLTQDSYLLWKKQMTLKPKEFWSASPLISNNRILLAHTFRHCVLPIKACVHKGTKYWHLLKYGEPFIGK